MFEEIKFNAKSLKEKIVTLNAVNNECIQFIYKAETF